MTQVTQATPLTYATGPAVAHLSQREAAKIPGQARGIIKLAEAADWAAAQLEEQAIKLVEKASEKNCIVIAPGGGRF